MSSNPFVASRAVSTRLARFSEAGKTALLPLMVYGPAIGASKELAWRR